MSAEEFAIFFAWKVKDGECTKSEAIMYYRNRHQTDFMTAMDAINFAIGDINEGIC